MVVEDQFPVGMRVLAVDDDPTCLKVLENLLRKCQYHVTTTNQAVTALNMLRENKNKYDLVISDVNMPDMDGFKLLELVGLEMDLPVIMLSSHGDKELVYKGITHGAVDYLLKPVRMEELKNIWQHVIRKKKLYPKEQRRSPNEGSDDDRGGEAPQGVASSGSSELCGKVNRKRKEQDEEEDEQDEENEPDNEENGTQKKPRVVWSVDLHQKFVAAVDQLGLDKAVPKKILDLMNVEGLTRENVASHLQKYRLYLKRISSGSTQNANLDGAFGPKESCYLRPGSMDGLDFRSWGGPGRYSGSCLSSYAPGGMLGRLNSSAGLSFRGISSSSLLQSPHSQTLSNSSATLGKFQRGLLPTAQVTNLFQGISTSVDPNQLQRRYPTNYGEFSCTNDGTRFLTGSNFPDSKMTVGGLGNTVAGMPSNAMMFQLNPPTRQSVHGSSNFLDHSTSNECWHGAAQLSTFPSSSMPMSEPFRNDPLSHTSNNTAMDFSSISPVTVPFDNSRADMQGQASITGNVVPNMDRSSKQRWEEHSQDYNPGPSATFNNMDSMISGNGVGPSSMDQKTKFDSSLIDQLNNGTPAVFQHAQEDPKMKSCDEGFLQRSKSPDGFLQNSYDFDELMNSIKRQEQNETLLVDGEFGFDGYPLGSCI